MTRGAGLQGARCGAAPAAPIADDDIPPARRIRLLDLKDADCHWPIGDPRLPDLFGFCGEPKLDGKPYCAAHAARAFEAARR